MIVSLRKFLFLVLMLLTLLAATLGLTARAITNALHPYSTNIQTQGQLAYAHPHRFCPPPPYIC